MMETYLVNGFSRNEEEKMCVSILVDCERGTSPHQIAEKIAGDKYCFHSSQNVLVHVPDDCKNILFKNDDELYARVPELNWRARRRRRSSKKLA